jgi:hypothetical protein
MSLIPKFMKISTLVEKLEGKTCAKRHTNSFESIFHLKEAKVQFGFECFFVDFSALGP